MAGKKDNWNSLAAFLGLAAPVEQEEPVAAAVEIPAPVPEPSSPVAAPVVEQTFEPEVEAPVETPVVAAAPPPPPAVPPKKRRDNWSQLLGVLGISSSEPEPEPEPAVAPEPPRAVAPPKPTPRPAAPPREPVSKGAPPPREPSRREAPSRDSGPRREPAPRDAVSSEAAEAPAGRASSDPRSAKPRRRFESLFQEESKGSRGSPPDEVADDDLDSGLRALWEEHAAQAPPTREVRESPRDREPTRDREPARGRDSVREIPRDVIRNEEIEDDSDLEELEPLAPVEAKADEEERPRRRRRRGGRRRGRGGAEGGAERAPAAEGVVPKPIRVDRDAAFDMDDRDAEDRDVADRDIEQDLDIDEDVIPTAKPVAAERAAGRGDRPKRRRRRRRRGEEDAAPGAVPAAPKLDLDDEDDDDSLDDGPASADYDADSSRGHGDHKRIPTWDEAIGAIVTANMETRNRPSQGGRGRDGGRGDHREGRDHRGGRR